MKEKISIIAPIYKVEEDKLERMILSCLKQTYENYELILVDDNGSNDYVGDYIDKIARRHDNVISLHQKNSGVSIARNLGLNKSTGDWICFVDADDWMEPDLLTTLFKECEDGVDMVACSCFVHQGSQKNRNTFLAKNEYFNSQDKDQIQLQLLSKGIAQYHPEFVAFGVPWAKLYRKSVLVEFGISFPEKIDKYEDAIFVFKFLEACNKVRYAKTPLYNYEVHDESLSHGFKEDVVEVTKKANLELKKLLYEYDKGELFQQAYHIKVVMSINSYLKQNILHKDSQLNVMEKRKAIKHIIESKEYIESINEVQIKYLSNKEKLLYCFLKLRLYSALIIIYTFL